MTVHLLVPPSSSMRFMLVHLRLPLMHFKL